MQQIPHGCASRKRTHTAPSCGALDGVATGPHKTRFNGGHDGDQ